MGTKSFAIFNNVKKAKQKKAVLQAESRLNKYFLDEENRISTRFTWKVYFWAFVILRNTLVFSLNICEWHGSPQPVLGLDLLRSAALSFLRAVICDFDIWLLVLKLTISSNLAHCCLLTNQTDWDLLGFDLRNQVPGVPATFHTYFVHVRDWESTGSLQNHFINTRTNNRAIDCYVWHIGGCRKYFSNASNLIHFSISPSEDTFSLEEAAAIITNFMVTGYNVFVGIRKN